MAHTFMLVLLLGLNLSFCEGAQTKYFGITTVIQNHFAETTLQSEVLNDRSESAEIGFSIMLPDEAFITHFEITIDEVTYEAVIEEKQKAKEKFTEAKRHGETAGLVETRGKVDRIFSTSVNVAANKEVQFKLIYQQLIRKIGGKYKSKIILFGDQLSDFLDINVHICEPRALTSVTVPSILLNDGGDVNPQATVRRNGNMAHVTFAGNDQVLNSLVSAKGGVFTVEYELESSPNSAEVIVNDGYFIYFGPDVEIKPRRMIFVLDDSGSMFGQKSQQVKKAMTNILGKLLPEDEFGIVRFSSQIRPWRKRVAKAVPENVEAAKAFVNGPDDGAGTRIWAALEAALNMMSLVDFSAEEDLSHSRIILLTDGAGELADEDLMRNVAELNRDRFSIHTISFGGDADDSLMQQIADKNHGSWKKILVDLDSGLQIEYFVDELDGLNLGDQTAITYPSVVLESLPVGFGREITSVGKFREGPDSYLDGPHEIAFKDSSRPDGAITSSFFLDQKDNRCAGMEVDEIKDFAAKAYGMAKVKRALKEFESSTNETEKAFLKEKAVNVSLENKLVTPVTSLLVIKPEETRTEEEDDSESPTTSLPPSAAPKWSLNGDPHFVAKISNDITVCFNWIGHHGEIVNLLHDIDNSIIINGLIEGEKDSITHRLFLTRLAIVLEEERLFVEIDPDGFTVGDLSPGKRRADGVRISLREIERRHADFGVLKFHVSEVKMHHIVLKIHIRKILFVVEIQHRYDANPKSMEHLDFVIPNYKTGNLGGVFGHLQMKNIMDVGEAKIAQSGKKNRTFLLYNNGKTRVRKTRMKIPYMKSEVDCWVSKGHFQHLLGSKLRDFKLSSLMELPRRV